ncbi:hypothetical protein G9A89_019597 [Geosiphon pyriformis]|nr:hypothetical protein G9A89_019597 [Geosiphon pyriformis]
MKKSVKGFSVDTVSKDVVSRKKRKGGVLKDSIVHNMVLPSKPVGSSWRSKAGDTTKSDSVDMEEEFLIEETNLNYGEGDVLEGKDSNQMPKGPRLVTKQALSKPLGKINFLGNDDDDNIFLNESVVLPPPLKKLVDVPTRKFFALNIDLVNISGKSAQDKLAVVRKLFSKINGFGGAFTLSKFSGIIWMTFTSKSSLMKTTKLAADAKILVNTDLKKSTGRSDWAVVLKEIPVETSAKAVHAALAEFVIIEFEEQNQADLLVVRWSILIGKDAVHVARSDLDKITWDIRDHYRTLLYTLSAETNAHNIWDFIGSVSGKTCVIDCHPVIYVWARCTIVCFESVELLDAVMGTTPMLKGAQFCWSYLGSAKYAKCRKLSHIFLGCVTDEKSFSGGLPCRILSDADKNRLAAIYTKHLAPIVCPISFGGISWAKIVAGSSFPPLPVWNVLLNNGSSSEMKPTLQVSSMLNNRFAALEHSLVSLAECMDKLAKRLDAPGPMVFQLSPGCQPLVTPSSQNQEADIVISKGSGVVIGGGTVAGVANFDSSVVSKMEEILRILSVIVISFSARMDNANLVWKFATCNVRGINVPAKQEDVVFMETKLRSGCRPWIKDRFDGVQIFTSGLDTGFLGAEVAIIMDVSLAQHVSKVSEVPGRLLSIKLLFKNKLSVSILGLYAGVSSVVWFSQAGDINSLIAKAVNKFLSFLVVISMKMALTINSLVGNSAVKKPTWANSRGIKKTIDYMLVSPNLVNTIVNHDVSEVSEHFNTDYQSVSVSVGLSRLLDMQLNSLCK